ncbi:MAG: 4Fe-4S dicluster domain-containing protein [Chloroflexi bacterium]|nr:MAG: 4Fe-4S dicluster domain-containing protein [Chloroflexota bacterium]
MAWQEKPLGFFTDTSICIGCKACEVACKEWNELPGNAAKFTADSFDNTGQLDAQNWRHVQFIEQVPDNTGMVVTPTPIAGGQAWLMMSDVCKHCKNASCLEVCPTNALMRTEFDTVYIQNDVCNGCRNCISACPYGVIGFNEDKGIAQKCTLCYDRLQGGLQPACAKACPTESIKFGYVEDLHAVADQRLATLKAAGYQKAQLYGRDDKVYGGLNAFFLLMDKPEVYKLPNEANATLPSRNNLPGYVGGVATAVIGLVAGLLAFRNGRMNGNGANNTTTTNTR